MADSYVGFNFSMKLDMLDFLGVPPENTRAILVGMAEVLAVSQAATLKAEREALGERARATAIKELERLEQIVFNPS